MAKDEQDTPGNPEPYEAEVKAHRLSERMARVDEVDDPDFIGQASANQSVSFHHLPDGRVARSAGRMVIGSRAPIPGPASANATSGAFEQSQLFSSNKDGRQRISGGAAVALACAVAVGSTAVLTSALNTSIEQDSGGRNSGSSDPGGRAEAGQVSSRAVMAPSAAEPQATQVASLSPAVTQSVAGADAGIIRIAKQDAPGLVVEDISGRPGSEILLRIEVAQSETEEYSFLMFRGLPAEITLSAGFRLKDSWAVSLRDLANLALVSPPNYEARFQVEVLLIKGRNTPADSRVMSVSLQRTAAPSAAPPAVAEAPRQEPAPQRILTAAPPEPQPEPATKIEAAAPSFAPAEPKKMAISPETEATMLDRATRMLSMGDVSSARLLFEHVAKKGSGKAAMALARTFDPAFFASINTRGLKPDRDKAKEWYSVAADLGQDEARTRLGALTSR